MSTHFRFEHDFAIDPVPYWQIFFSLDYVKDLYAELKMKDLKILEFVDDGQKLRRALRITPAKEVPALFRSVIKDTSYIERNLFVRDRSAMEVVVESALMKDRFDMRGVYSVMPTAGGKCRRTFEGDVRIAIPLLGGKIEKYVVEEVRVSYDIAARVTDRWIEKASPTPR